MICFFNTISSWGGGEKWHVEMALEVSKKEEVLFICSKNSEIAQRLQGQSNIQLEYASVNNLSFLDFIKVSRISRLLKRYNVETIVLNSSQDMKCGGLAAKKASVKRIVYRRGSAIPIKNTFVNRFFFTNVITEILANSEATKKTINKNGALFSDEKIRVIPNGIDLQFLEEKYSILYQKQGDEIVLGNLGRTVYQKNQTFLLDVAKELKSRNVRFTLLIGGDGKLLSDLKLKAKELEIENEVRFLGFISKPKDFMMSLDVFLLSSHWEGFGYVLAEAMLCKKPAIAFDISSNSQIVQHNQNGFLVNYQSLDEFCDKIEQLAEEEELRKSFGVEGERFVKENFNKEYIANQVVDYLVNNS